VYGRPHPPSGRIRLPLARDPADRRRVIVLPTGAPSETAYDAIGSLDTANGPVSLIRCMLITGRTHQIRVHLEASGWPILGDPLYGRPAAGIARQALHAWRIDFTHPITDQRHRVVAPLPADILHIAGPLAERLPHDEFFSRA
jgi:23S rRNA pseudouridine1911/1915/1917 synthase